MTRAFACSALLLALSGCSLLAPAPVKKVAAAQNVYDFRIARFDEACNAVPAVYPHPRPIPPAPAGFIRPAWCAKYLEALNAFELHLKEARIAIDWGGAMPLQLEVLALDQAAVDPKKVK